MHEEQREDYDDRRLCDEINLERFREPVEALAARQNRPDEYHVAPHEQGEHETRTTAEQLVQELLRCGIGGSQ